MKKYQRPGRDWHDIIEVMNNCDERVRFQGLRAGQRASPQKNRNQITTLLNILIGAIKYELSMGRTGDQKLRNLNLTQKSPDQRQIIKM
jgi:hypothetical protein